MCQSCSGKDPDTIPGEARTIAEFTIPHSPSVGSPWCVCSARVEFRYNMTHQIGWLRYWTPWNIPWSFHQMYITDNGGYGSDNKWNNTRNYLHTAIVATGGYGGPIGESHYDYVPPEQRALGVGPSYEASYWTRCQYMPCAPDYGSGHAAPSTAKAPLGPSNAVVNSDGTTKTPGTHVLLAADCTSYVQGSPRVDRTCYRINSSFNQCYWVDPRLAWYNNAFGKSCWRGVPG
jgi:hypothetical protein